MSIEVKPQRYPDGHAPSHLIEVRCCCQPQKLLGWLPKLADGITHYNLDVPNVGRYSLPIATICETPVISEHLRIAMPTAVRDLVEETHKHTRRLAVKAEGMSIDQLKKVRAFIPND